MCTSFCDSRSAATLRRVACHCSSRSASSRSSSARRSRADSPVGAPASRNPPAVSDKAPEPTTTLPRPPAPATVLRPRPRPEDAPSPPKRLRPRRTAVSAALAKAAPLFSRPRLWGEPPASPSRWPLLAGPPSTWWRVRMIDSDRSSDGSMTLPGGTRCKSRTLRFKLGEASCGLALAGAETSDKSAAAEE